MNAKITECNSEKQQNICIALKYLLQNIYYYGHFNIYPQILWHSSLQEAELKFPSLENGLDLVICLQSI